MKPFTLAYLLAAMPLVVASSATLAAQTALTIYNQNFAVVREIVPLDLAAGITPVTFDRATLQVEPDSVVLRDPTGKVRLRVLEQSYRAETASQGLLLALHEGNELDFVVRDRDAKEHRVRGKVIRSGYLSDGQPIVEVDGQLRFSLPGEPLFPALADDAVLRPTLSWQIATEEAVKFDAELAYITGGLSWQSAYNLVSPEKGDRLDLVGWVTIENQTGRTFDAAKVKLMAGDVNKLAPEPMRRREIAGYAMATMVADQDAVTQKAFDEFHLYALPRAVTLRNRETKQVEFLRATGIKAPTLYIYDGANLAQYRGWNDESIRENPDFGTQSNPKIGVYREFKNTKENGLGLPLPKGRTRFYRTDSADGGIEFTGENMLDHTPEGETVRIYTGDAFDLVGERKRTDFVLNNRNDQAEEAFAITLRNRKKEPVEIRVVERLYRGVNWTILEKSDEFTKTDDRNIEIRVTLQPDEERVVTYRVRYDWK